MKTIKFKEVKIGAKVLSKVNQINIKVDEELAFNFTLGHLEPFGDDEEVELITKCENCKCFIRKNTGYFYCKELNEDINQNPETFSCSLFEMKEE